MQYQRRRGDRSGPFVGAVPGRVDTDSTDQDSFLSNREFRGVRRHDLAKCERNSYDY